MCQMMLLLTGSGTKVVDLIMLLSRMDDLVNKIENAKNWDDVDKSEYVEVCEALGMNYDDYDDPDKLFKDIKDKYFKITFDFTQRR